MKTTKRYGKKADLALSTWVKLARAYTSFNKKSTDNIRTFGLTQPQFAVIEVLGHLGALKVGEICSKMLASGGNMTLVLDNVEKLGFVERTHSREDRRAILVQLTPKGKQLFDDVFVKHAEQLTKYMSALSSEEQKILGDLLKKLGTSVGKL
ncbi:MAG: MarR family transcriptional regulator [Ignavibacteria bacterium]|nr:MAG: MarR family transcriptional regulator [Ignavibacteria bacterium]KAF0160840.1 MAG: MarR family transcriptional regulator [Ignavibacteria bacterium]